MLNKLTLFFEYYLPFITWLMIIFVFSHIPQLQSPLPGLPGYLFRKTAHFVEYFILAYFAFRILLKYHKLTLAPSLTLTFVLCLTYAITDEYHQRFVYGRKGSLMDILIDTSGILTFLISVFLSLGLKKNNKFEYN